MPNSPLSVSGAVTDVGDAAVTSGLLTIHNCTKGETTSVSINASGQYVINLGTLTTQWEVNDVIFVTAECGAKGQGVVIWKITATDTDIIIDICCKNKSFTIGSSNRPIFVHSMSASVGATAYDFILIERKSGTAKGSLKSAANSLSTNYFGYPGIPCYGGYYVIRTAQNAAVNPNKLTAGVANKIGDTSTNNLVVVSVAED